MIDPHYRMRNMALYVSESLYKAGDKSFESDYKRLIQDSNTEVKVRALMIAKMFKIPGLVEVAREAMAADKSAGVKLVATNIITPPRERYSHFGRKNPNLSNEQKSMNYGRTKDLYGIMLSMPWCRGAWNSSRRWPLWLHLL